jgi:GNAT superfamily N-acetyltransferase
MNEMGYIVTEVNNDKLDWEIKEIAECMKVIQWHNERGIYAGNHSFMGYQGYSLPSMDEYKGFIKDIINRDTAKIIMVKEDCCGEKIIGLTVGGLTDIAEESKKRSGRILFFWVHPEYRKSNITKKMYKALFGWFKKSDCISVSISFKHFQKNLARFFLKNGYMVENMELVGPVEVV